MNEPNRIDIRFNISGQILTYRNAILISNKDNLITFIDNKDKRTKTYSKEYLVSYEILEGDTSNPSNLFKGDSL